MYLQETAREEGSDAQKGGLRSDQSIAETGRIHQGHCGGNRSALKTVSRALAREAVFEGLLATAPTAYRIVADCAHGVLTPYRGTPLYDQLVEEGRLLADRGIAFYNGYNVAFQPMLMSPDDLLQAHRALWRKAFSPWYVFRRIVREIGTLRPGALFMSMAMNGFYGLKMVRGNAPLVAKQGR